MKDAPVHGIVRNLVAATRIRKFLPFLTEGDGDHRHVLAAAILEPRYFEFLNPY